MKINNVPEYAAKYQYWVVREVDGELWFWGAYDAEDRAGTAAKEVSGIVLDMIKGR